MTTPPDNYKTNTPDPKRSDDQIYLNQIGESDARLHDQSDELTAQDQEGKDAEAFQETVAIPPEELDMMIKQDEEAKDTEAFQETVAIPPEELDKMIQQDEESKDTEAFQETVAIPPEELDRMIEQDEGAGDAEAFQETVAIPPEELERMIVQDEGTGDTEAFQETVAIPPEELDRMIEQDEGSEEAEAFQETVAIPPEELERMIAQDERTGDTEEFQETVAIPPEELDKMIQQDEAEEAVAISAEELDKMMAPDKASLGQSNEKASEPGPHPAIHPENVSPDNDDMSVIAAMRDKLDMLITEDAGYEEEAKDTAAIPHDHMARMLEHEEDQPIEKAFQTSPAMAPFETTPLENQYFHEDVCKSVNGGKYKLNTKLFAGGMGAILEVEDRYLDRISAMKVILPEKKDNTATLQQFIAEAKITAMLEHPNIIPVHELGLLNAAGLYFTMKLAEGEALNDILNKLMNNDAEYINTYNTYHLLNIFRKVCDAVSFAHSRHIIHQDIKPHNVMVGQYGEVLLMDWGLARQLKPYPPETEKHPLSDLAPARDNRITGSPTYMSPEQTYGDPDKMCERSDIFLLGAMLYHIFTLTPPYNGKSMKEIILKARAGDFVPPQTHAPHRQIPDEINRIISKAMAFKKEDRYQSVDAISHDVDDIIAGKWSQQVKKDFQTGEMLMTEGEIGEEAYLILKGRVRVVKERAGKKIILGLLQTGDIVGEMSLIRKEKRSASVEAVEPTQAAVLNREVLSRNLKKLPPYMEKIVSTLTDRLRSANEKIHPHLVRDCTYVILKQLRLLYWHQLKNKSEAAALTEGVETNAMIAEIAEDLGLPHERVNIVLRQAAKMQLIDNTDNTIKIPDDEKFTQFCERAKAGL